MNKIKRTASIVGIVLLVSMYIISLITAIFASEHAPGMFLASIFCTVVIPILVYIFITLIKIVYQKNSPSYPEEEELIQGDSSDKSSLK